MAFVRRWSLGITLVVCILINTPVYSQEASKKLESIWNKFSTEGQRVLDQSIQSLREITSEI